MSDKDTYDTHRCQCSTCERHRETVAAAHGGNLPAILLKIANDHMAVLADSSREYRKRARGCCPCPTKDNCIASAVEVEAELDEIKRALRPAGGVDEAMVERAARVYAPQRYGIPFERLLPSNQLAAMEYARAILTAAIGGPT